MTRKYAVAIVGATGVAGQQFVDALRDHPWLEVKALAASERNKGKTYMDALRDENSGALLWWSEELPPAELQTMVVQSGAELDPESVDIIFDAVESGAARELELRYGKSTPTISTASAFRMEADTPVIIPGVNDAHCGMIEQQRKNRGWKGFVIPIPNCTTCGLAVTLAPLHRAFGVKQVVMTSMQAVSGAGRPGVMALDNIDNVVPFIPGEEEKVERETQKILGDFRDGAIHPAAFPVSATCTRVPVIDGHTETVFVATEKPCRPADAIAAWQEFRLDVADLPSAPQHMVLIHDDPFRPQPRMDRNHEGGMATSVGRVRPDQVLGGVKYVLVSHNTKMGAAKGAVLVAEHLAATGMICPGVRAPVRRDSAAGERRCGGI